VRSVEKGSKAEAAGLKAGDVIIRVDNDRVSDTRDWSRLLRSRDGGTVKVGIMRDRREQTLSITLPERKSEESSYWYSYPDSDELRMQWQKAVPDQAALQAKIAREMAAHQREIQQAMRDAQRDIERSMRDIERDRARAVRDAYRSKEKPKDKEKDKEIEEQ